MFWYKDMGHFIVKCNETHNCEMYHLIITPKTPQVCAYWHFMVGTYHLKNPPSLGFLAFHGGQFFSLKPPKFSILSVSWGSFFFTKTPQVCRFKHFMVVFRLNFYPPSFDFSRLLGGIFAWLLPPKFAIFRASWGVGTAGIKKR